MPRKKFKPRDDSTYKRMFRFAYKDNRARSTKSLERVLTRRAEGKSTLTTYELASKLRIEAYYTLTGNLAIVLGKRRSA